MGNLETDENLQVEFVGEGEREIARSSDTNEMGLGEELGLGVGVGSTVNVAF